MEMNIHNYKYENQEINQPLHSDIRTTANRGNCTSDSDTKEKSF